jgi:hypothetical protein
MSRRHFGGVCDGWNHRRGTPARGGAAPLAREGPPAPASATLAARVSSHVARRTRHWPIPRKANDRRELSLAPRSVEKHAKLFSRYSFAVRPYRFYRNARTYRVATLSV